MGRDSASHCSSLCGPKPAEISRMRAAAASTLAFGPQTWPHALARAMLADKPVLILDEATSNVDTLFFETAPGPNACK